MSDKVTRDNATIRRAMKIMEERMRYTNGRKGDTFTSPDQTKEYFVLRLAEYEREVFACLFMDNQNQLITCEELFYGTIDGATIHVREVVKAALKHNAAAVVFAHNHPSGKAEPSNADRQITSRLEEALRLIGVRVLDHIVVGGTDTTSFAEAGLM